MKKKSFFYLFFIFIVFFLRFYNLEKITGFAADQEFYSWEAKKILIDHKLTLIGIPTSFGGLFVAPLYTYLAALFYWFFQMNPLAGAVLSSLISSFIPFLAFFIAWKVFDFPTGVISGILITFSEFFIRYGRMAWPVNPMHIISLFLIWAMTKTLKNEKYLILIGLLLGLGFHFHLNVFTYFPLLFLCFLILKPKIKEKKTFLFAIFSFFLMISPLILFEIRHRFFLTQRFFNLIKTAGEQGGENFNLFSNILKILRINFENFSAVLFLKKGLPVEVFSLIIIFLYGSIIFFREKEKTIPKIFLCFILGSFFTYGFFKAHMPEYYLLPLNPIWVMIIAYVFSYFWKRKNLKIFTAALLIVFIFINFSLWKDEHNALSLFYKKQAVKFIIQKAEGKPFFVSYITQPGYHFGYPYLFYYYSREPEKELISPVFNIIVPNGYENIQADKVFGAIGVQGPIYEK